MQDPWALFLPQLDIGRTALGYYFSHNSKFLLFYFYVPECFAWMYVCAPCSYLVLEKALEKCRIPWDWSYRREPSCQRLELNPGLLEEGALSCHAL